MNVVIRPMYNDFFFFKLSLALADIAFSYALFLHLFVHCFSEFETRAKAEVISQALFVYTNDE